MGKGKHRTEHVGQFLFNINRYEYEILRVLLNDETQGATVKQLKRRLDARNVATGVNKAVSYKYVWDCINQLEHYGVVETDYLFEVAKRVFIPEKIKGPLSNVFSNIVYLEDQLKTKQIEKLYALQQAQALVLNK